MLSENQKIGVGLVCLGGGFMLLGCLMLFDVGFLVIGNILFLTGLAFAIGVRRSLLMFTRRDKLRGSICFFLGILGVLLKYPFFGFVLECFGFLNLFGNFFPVVVSFLRQVPYLSGVLSTPWIADIVDRIAGKARPSV